MRLAPLLAGVVATLVTSIAIGVPAPWRDEQATAAAASRDWGQLLELVTGTTDAVHAGYYALMKPWVDLFGVDPFWLRLPSAIAVGFAAAGIVVLGTMLDRTRTGVIAAAILVLLPRVFWAGGEARSYALQIAAAVWLTVLFVTAVRRGGRWRWVAFARRDGRRELAVPVSRPGRGRAARHPRTRPGVAARSCCPLYRGDRAPGVAALPIVVLGFSQRCADLLGAGARYRRPRRRREVAVVHGIDGVLDRRVAARRRRGRRNRGDRRERATRDARPAAAVAHPADRRCSSGSRWSSSPIYLDRYLVMSAPAIALLAAFAIARLPGDPRRAVLAVVVAAAAGRRSSSASRPRRATGARSPTCRIDCSVRRRGLLLDRSVRRRTARAHHVLPGAFARPRRHHVRRERRRGGHPARPRDPARDRARVLGTGQTLITILSDDSDPAADDRATLERRGFEETVIGDTGLTTVSRWTPPWR